MSTSVTNESDEHTSTESSSPHTSIKGKESVGDLNGLEQQFSDVVKIDSEIAESQVGNAQEVRDHVAASSKIPPVTNAPKSVRRVAACIADAKTKILVLSGAGISVSAGVPDFRSKGTGLYVLYRNTIAHTYLL
jgi:NAD+-dependent protein deacetylase sirtuin 2